MLKLEQISKIVEAILVYDFQSPLTWVMIGINGTILSGRTEFSLAQGKSNTTVLTGKAKKLRLPINILLVDKNGKAVHIPIKRPNKIEKPTNPKIGYA